MNMIVNTTTGEAFATNVTWMEPTATDNSGETPVPVSDYTSGDNMFAIGDTTVQYNVSDSAGNFNDSCNFVITVEDNESPMIDCPTNVTSNNYIGEGYGLVNVSTDIGSPNATVTWDPPVTSDNNGGLVTVMSSYFESGDMIPYGTHTITFTATDPYGNIDTCVFGLNVEDNEDPVLVCPPNITTTTAESSDQAVNVNWTDPIVIDNSDEDITPTSKYNPGNNEFDIGRTDVIYDAFDSSGNAGTCTFTVTVTDPEAPDIIDCPMDIIVNTTTGEAFAINVTWVEPTATDNSEEAPVPVADYTSDDNMFPIGDTTVQYNVSDSAGNFNDSCSFVITVEDNESPMIDCPTNVTSNNYIGEGYGLVNVSTDIGSPNATVTWDPPETSDNSGGLVTVMSSYFESGDMIPYGTHTITFTATDPYGNIDTCDFGLNVEDNEDPVLVCPPNITTTTAEGSDQAVNVNWTDPIVIDNSNEDITPTSKYNPGNNEFDIGRTDVIYDAFDSSGNAGTCTFTVTVTDLEAPDIIDCPMDIIVNTTTGEAFAINVTWMEPTATDNSEEAPVPVADYTSDDNMFPIGDTTVQYNVSDSAGNFNDSCSFVITVEDNESPMIDCPTNVTSNNYIGEGYGLVNVSTDIGSPNATVTWDPPETSDNSGGLVTVMSSYFESGDMIPYGTHTITFTATDPYGNIDTCDFGLNVEDNEDPVLVCPPNITTTTAEGSDQAVNVSWTDPIVIDNSNEDITPTSKYNPGNNEFDIGRTDVIYDAFDSSGNAGTCTFTVTVTDLEAPDIIDCPMDIIVNTTTGEAFAINVTWMEPTATDNSEETPVPVSDYTSGDNMFAIGDTTVQYNVSDSADNFNDSCNFVITVEDNESPMIDCPTNVTSNNYIGEGYGLVNVSTDIGSPNATVTWDLPVTSDNSGGLVTVMSSYFESGDMIPYGTHTITFTATDPYGNIDTCDFGLNVEDNEDPVLVCPPNITTTTAEGSDQAVNVNWTDPIVIDNSDEDITPTSKYNPGNNEFDIGRTDVIYDAVDSSGNAGTCTFTVTVTDLEAPDIIDCPMDIIVNTTTGEAFAINVTWMEPTATDNSEETPVPVSDYTSGDNMFAIGDTTVQYNVSDSADNFNDSCNFVITVEDNESPMIDCPTNVTSNNYIGEGYGLVNVSTDIGSPNATVTWDLPVTSDNSGGLVTVMSSYFESGDMIPYGTHTITFTATDPYGNIDTCDFGLNVEDNEDPVLVCPPNITTSTVEGSEQAVNVSWTDPIVIDNSDEDITPTSKYNPGNNEFDIGRTDVIYDAVDSSGNAGTCTFIVTVTDNEDPVFDCPDNIMVYTDESQYYSTVYWNVSVTDNSGNVTYNCTSESGNQFDAVWPIIQQNVSCMAQDPSGNDASCFFTVTVDDNENPNITCPSDFNVTTDNGQPTAWIQWNVEYTDNTESLYNLSLTGTGSNYNPSGENFPIGTTTLKYIVTDVFGNIDSCTFDVTVRDEEAPYIAGCPMDIVLNTTSMLSHANATWMTPNATDNSGNVTLVATHYPGDGFAATITQVTYTATDPYGNEDICIFNVTVIDTESPTLDCVSNVTVYTDLNSATANVSWRIPETTDNSGLEPILTSNYEPYTLFDIGTTLVMYTSTDTSDNGETCTFNVTVIDNEDPVFDCPDNIMVYTDESQYYSTVYWNVSVTDNSGNVTYNCTSESGDQFDAVWPIIQQNVSCMTQDPSGNDASCFFTVTVDDNENPNITCPSDFNVTTNNGQPTAWIQWDVEYTDNTESLYNLSLTGSGLDYNPSGENFPIGTTTLKYIVTDAFGNTDSCTFDVTVRDEEAPYIAGCPMDIVLNTTSMLSHANATWMTPNATDNSGNVTLVSTHNPGDGFAATITQVTYTATDPYGNEDICTFNVTVIDTESPTLDCVSNVTVYTDLNSATANVSWPIPETTDNSGLDPTLTSNYEPYTLFDIGTTLVMYTSTDTSDNGETCTFNVTVIDNEDPVFDCPDNIMVYTDESQYYSTVYWNVSVTDNSGNVTYNCTSESGDQFDAVWPIIQQNVSCMTQDPSGNDASCFFTVTVDDNENPNITCPSDFNVTTNNGQPTAWIQWDVEYTDNTESLYNLSLTGSGLDYNPSGENFPIGTTTLKYIVTDAFGNTDSCTFDVTVRDEEAPYIAGCPMDIVLNTTSMLSHANATWMTPNATDNSGNVTLVATHYPGDGFAATITQVTYTATDPYGNKEICTFNVTVIDTESPTLDCVSNVTVYTDLNSATANVSWPIPETTDNSGLEPTLTSNYEPYTLFDIGTTLVMYTSTDTSDNEETCTFNVTVIDNEDPVFDCPDNIMVYTDESQYYSTVYWNVSVTDNSGNFTYNCTSESGNQFDAVWPIIQQNVSCMAQDPSENDASCFFTVTVDDNENPNITCPSDFNVTTSNGKPTAWIRWDVEYTDNTESLYDLSLTGSGSSYNQSGDNFPIGTTTLKYIVTDAFGNIDSCTFDVIVRDTEAPMLTCPDDIVNTTVIGEEYGIANWVEPEITDNSGIIYLNMSNFISGDQFYPGNTTVYYYAEDPSGNYVNCSFIVTIDDFQIPIFDPCPANIDVNTDPTLPYAVVNWTIAVDDNVGIVTLESNYYPLDKFNITVTEVIYVATDTDNNQAECKFNITVTDNEIPIIDGCPDDVTINTTSGLSTGVYTWPQVNATDNSGSVNLFGPQPPGNTFTIGVTSILYIAIDDYNNLAQCEFTITVIDVEAPVIDSCPEDMIAFAEVGDAYANVSWVEPIAMDNSGTLDFEADKDVNSGFPIGSTIVTYTASDESGNQEICSFNLTVFGNDMENPVFENCPSDINRTTIDGESYNVAVWPDIMVTDNIKVYNTSMTHMSGDNFSIGMTEVIYTAFDSAGNVMYCEFIVWIIDNEIPTLNNCSEDISQVALLGENSTTVSWDKPVAGDNSGENTLTSNYYPGAMFYFGDTVVTYTIVDPSENSNNCSFTVTVEDEEAPTISNCPASIIVEMDEGKNSTDVTSNYNEPTITDNNILSDVVVIPSGQIFFSGTTTVTYTATDVSGNEAECSFNITVIDTQPPEYIGCPSSPIIELVPIGMANRSVSWTEPTATDNAGIYKETSTHNPGDIFEIGTVTVTYTVYDTSDLSSTCVFDVTVQDTEDPVFMNCPTSPINMDTNEGLAYANVSWDDPEPMDNSGVFTVNQEVYSGDGFYVGFHTVTITAVDEDGNIGICSFTIIVEDNEDPEFNCSLTSVVVEVGMNSSTAEADWILEDATDNVGVVRMTQSHNQSYYFVIGMTMVTYNAWDEAGNEGSCSFYVIVTDNYEPVISGCPDSLMFYTDPGQASGTANWTEPTAFDNSGYFSWDISHQPLSTFPIGETWVSYNATDNSGNTDYCWFVVVIIDNEDPWITCPSNITMASDPNSATAVVNWMEPSVMDNSNEVIALGQSHSSGDMFPFGETEVVYVAVDAYNNTAVCSFIIYIYDDEPPVFDNCPASAVMNVLPIGQASMIVNWTDITATDNDGSNPPVSCEPEDGSIFDIGTFLVTCNATDMAGLTAVCEFDLTVADEENPVVLQCPGMQIGNTNPGHPNGTVSWTVTASDNSGNYTIEETLTSGALLPIGNHINAVTVTDPSGNQDRSCFILIVIEDNEDPSISCPANQTLETNVDLPTAYVTWENATAWDNSLNVMITSDPALLSPYDFPIGTSSVVYTATDGSGNSASCEFIVWVEDTQPPDILSCPNNTELLTMLGESTVQYFWNNPVAIDNSGNEVTFTSDIPNGSDFESGNTTVTITADDGNNNVAYCNFTVTVIDDKPPYFDICPINISMTLPPDASGNNVTVSWRPPIANDLESSPLVIWLQIFRLIIHYNSTSSNVSVPPYDFPVGINEVLYKVTDDFGNNATCSFFVEIIDDTDPIISCPSYRNYSTEDGESFAHAAWDEVTAMDNSGSVEVAPTTTNGYYNVGDYSILFVASDESNNEAYCSFNFSVIDTEPPSLTNFCPESQTEIGSSVTFAWTPPTFSDNVGVVETFFPDRPVLTLLVSDGTTLVNYTAVDGAGNSLSCIFNLTVEDSDAPIFDNCENVTVTGTTSPRSNSTTVSLPVLTATDNSGDPPTIRNDYEYGNVFWFGETEVVFTASDLAGNQAMCIVTVNIQDEEDPTFVMCPGSMSRAANGTTATHSWEDPVVEDNVAVASVIPDISPGSVFPLGTTVVTYTATDTSSNEETCSFTVTVTDEDSPYFDSCPPSQTVCAIEGNTTYFVSWFVPIAMDNDGQPNVTESHSPDMVYYVGIYDVTYTATDSSGNEGFCSFVITVRDCESPKIFDCPDGISEVPDSGSNSTFVTWEAPTATDNSNDVTITSPNTPGRYSGETLITYTAVDRAGNIATCMFNVVIGDSEAPTFENCPTSSINFTTTEGESYVNVSWVTPTAEDNAGPSGITITEPNNVLQYSNLEIGVYELTYVATDEAGNSVSCMFSVMVLDNENPSFDDCPPNLEFETVVGSINTTVTWTVPSVSDNSNEVITPTSSIQPNTVVAIGTSVVTYTAKDSSNNVAMCSFAITVNAGEAPEFTSCPDDTIEFPTSPGVATGIATWDQVVAEDNIGTPELTQSHMSNTTFSLGTTTVEYNATDSVGNTAMCTFTVDIKDMEDPVFVNCPGNLYLNETNVAHWQPPTATDNAGTVTIVSTDSPGVAYAIGDLTVVYTATDESGNTEMCSFDITITVLGTPVVQDCPEMTIEAETTGDDMTVEVTWAEPTAIDDGEVTTESTHDPGDMFDIGTTTVRYTFTDEDGQESVCSFNVEVTAAPDETDPVITCPENIEMSLGPNEIEITLSWEPATAVDSRDGDLETSSTYNMNTPFSEGTTSIEYFAFDSSNNEASCTFMVTINAYVDTVSPVFTECPDNVTKQTLEGTSVNSAEWNEPEATDDNGEPVVVQVTQFSSGENFSFGTTAVRYEATDIADNTAVCEFFVTIEDDEDPTFSNCPGPIDQNTIPGTLTAEVEWTPPTPSDNVELKAVEGGQFFSCNYNSGAVFDAGTETVTCTATDTSGNIGTCSFDVTVTVLPDSESPTFDSCPEDQSRVVGATTATTSFTWNVPTATDNSGMVTVTSIDGYKPGDSFTAGEMTLVTYTAVDPTGLQTICSFTIEVIVDDEPPNFSNTCPDNIVVTNPDPQTSANVSWTPPVATDTSEIFTQISNMPYTDFPLGTTTVTYTFIDAFTNQAVCEFDVLVQNEDLCEPTPCMNGATCTNDGFDYTCACASGWTGTNCDADINECDNAQACDSQFTCENVDGSFLCNCPTGQALNSVNQCETGMSITGEITTEGDYTDDLSDSASVAFQTLASQFIIEILRVLQANLFGVFDVIIISFRSGSIVADFVVIVNGSSNITATDIQIQLDNDIQENNGMLGELNVTGNGVMVIEVVCEDGYCKNGGVCSITNDYNSLCTCVEPYTGTTCEELIDSVDPVFTECPAMITYNVLSASETVLVRWTATATDNSGIPSLMSDPYTSGESRLGPGVYTNVVTAEDEYGNEAMCTIRITVQTAQTTYRIATTMTLDSKSDTFLQDLDDLYRLTSLADEFVGVTSSDSTADQMSLTFYFTSNTVTEDMILSAFMAVAPSNVFGGNTVTAFFGDGPCDGSSCSGNGDCMSTSSTEYSCTCNEGWEGDDCDTDINECTDSSKCPAAGEVCQNSAGAYECLCASGQWKINEQCTDVTEFISNFVITSINGVEQTFSEQLNDETSEEYQALQDQLLPLLVDAFDNLPDYLGVRIIDFAGGSVKVYFVVVFETGTSTTADDVTSAINAATEGGILGGSTIRVDNFVAADTICVDYCQNGGICSTNSFYIESCECADGYSGDICSFKDTDDPNLTTLEIVAIVLGSVFGVLIIVIIIVATIALSAKSRRRTNPIYDNYTGPRDHREYRRRSGRSSQRNRRSYFDQNQQQFSTPYIATGDEELSISSSSDPTYQGRFRHDYF
ncbi:uncharacterized protein [Antedon mediterranea]|uniref:uncharacterized protein n=1 Tax=Antedon mediterranea TaxID=105859 RepID=UPI003AF9589D